MAKFVTKKDNYFQGLFRVISDSFSSFDRFTKGLLIFTALFLLATPYIVKQYQTISGHASTVYDLKSYFPNTDFYKNYYLEGKNYVNSQSPSRAVLWFEPQDQSTYKMYNSAPEDANSRCHYDQLSWWDDGFLRYVKTHDECPGHTPNEIVYESPIIFLPRSWDSSTPWSFSGQSNAKYYQNGVVACEGTNSYKGEIVGLEQIAPNEQGIHWRTTQTTSWTSGSIPGGCSAGSTTHWQEDYWLTDILPVANGTPVKGLKRSKGGNLDVASDSWDIWFDTWKLLPWAPTPTSAPILTPTPTPTPKPTLTPTPKDTIAPLISIISPQNGTIVNRNTTVTLKASASDNVAVLKVEFYYKSAYLANTLICPSSSAPYTCNLTVPGTRNVTYTITAKAYDTSGNTSSNSISLRVRK